MSLHELDGFAAELKTLRTRFNQLIVRRCTTKMNGRFPAGERQLCAKSMDCNGSTPACRALLMMCRCRSMADIGPMPGADSGGCLTMNLTNFRNAWEHSVLGN